jgi:hypothetical protein
MKDKAGICFRDPDSLGLSNQSQPKKAYNFDSTVPPPYLKVEHPRMSTSGAKIL